MTIAWIQKRGDSVRIINLKLDNTGADDLKSLLKRLHEQSQAKQQQNDNESSANKWSRCRDYE